MALATGSELCCPIGWRVQLSSPFEFHMLPRLWIFLGLFAYPVPSASGPHVSIRPPTLNFIADAAVEVVLVFPKLSRTELADQLDSI
jgi:hypothetical protein